MLSLPEHAVQNAVTAGSCSVQWSHWCHMQCTMFSLLKHTVCSAVTARACSTQCCYSWSMQCCHCLSMLCTVHGAFSGSDSIAGECSAQCCYCLCVQCTVLSLQDSTPHALNVLFSTSGYNDFFRELRYSVCHKLFSLFRIRLIRIVTQHPIF